MGCQLLTVVLTFEVILICSHLEVRKSVGIGFDCVGCPSVKWLAHTFMVIVILKSARPFWISLSHNLRFSSFTTPNHFILVTWDLFFTKVGLLFVLLHNFHCIVSERV